MKQNIQLIKYDNRRNASQLTLLRKRIPKSRDLSDALRNYQKNNFYTIPICTSGSAIPLILWITLYQQGTILTIRKDQIIGIIILESKDICLSSTRIFIHSFWKIWKLPNASVKLFNELIMFFNGVGSWAIWTFIPLVSVEQEYNRRRVCPSYRQFLLNIFLNKLLR